MGLHKMLLGLGAGVTLTTDTLGELHVLGHDGHTLGVDRATVGILVKTNLNKHVTQP